MARNILHCNMNNFYASVECMLNPALKEYPVAVCVLLKNDTELSLLRIIKQRHLM